MNIVEDFQRLLSREDISEQDCQNFLECNTELIYTPFLLNHWILGSSIISKFPLDTSLITDFAYITKSSDKWVLVLVELEHPRKRLFRNDSKNIIPTSDLTEGIAQIDSWRDFIDCNRSSVEERLYPLLQGLTRHTGDVKYLLVIGRSEEKVHSEAKRKRLANMCAEDMEICTYDSLISWYHNNPREPKNIISLRKNKFKIKHLNTNPRHLLSHLTPEYIRLTEDQKQLLKNRGLEIDHWERENRFPLGSNSTSKEQW